MEYIECHICKTGFIKEFLKEKCLQCSKDEDVLNLEMVQDDINEYNRVAIENMKDPHSWWTDSTRFEIRPEDLFIAGTGGRDYVSRGANGRYVAVFGITFQSGKRFFDELIDRLNISEIISLVENHNRCECQTVNGTIYRLLPSSETARGHRYTDVYIQNGIDIDIIHSVILPSLWIHEDGSDPTVTYYD